MILRVYWTPVNGEINHYDIKYTIKVKKVDKFSTVISAKEEDCKTHYGQLSFEIKNIPTKFIRYYYDNVEAFNCWVQVRAVGKNGRKGAWSKNIKIIEGAKDDKTPLIQSILVENRDGSVYYENMMFEGETSFINLGGQNFKKVDFMGLCQLDGSAKNTLNKLRNNKIRLVKRLEIDESSKTDDYIRGELKDSLSKGKYLVFLRQGRILSKGEAIINVLPKRKKFGATEIWPELSAHIPFQLLNVKGHAFLDLLKTKDVSIKDSVIKGAKRGAVVGAVAGVGWEIVTNPAAFIKPAVAAFKKSVAIVGSVFSGLPAIIKSGVIGGTFGGLIGATIGFMYGVYKKGEDVSKYSDVIQELKIKWKELLDKGNYVIPIKRDRKGNHSNDTKKEINKMINEIDKDFAFGKELLDNADYILNPEMFRIIDNNNEAQNISVIFASLQTPRDKDDNLELAENLMKFIILIRPPMEFEGKTKKFLLQGKYYRFEWQDIGKFIVNKEIGMIEGTVKISGDFMGSEKARAYDSLVKLENKK